jgi:hypothetical protein
MSEGRRGGERRRHAPSSARTRRRHEQSSQAHRGRVLRSVLRPVHVDPHYAPQAQASEVGRSREHRGRANLRKQEEPAPGLSRTNVARLAACHHSRKGEAWHDEEKEGDRGLRPCEDQESGFGCSHVVMQLQKSVGGVWPRISSANALQKERSGSSERGPSSERGSAGETVGSHIERRARRESASPQSRERTGARPRVTRDRHPAVATSPKAVRWSRDRGCNGHRILRRVPIDGRHPGSSRSVGFHETASTVISAVSTPSDPRQTSQKEATRPGCSRRESARGERVEQGDRDRGVRGSIASTTVGRKRPRSCLQAVRQ